MSWSGQLCTEPGSFVLKLKEAQQFFVSPSFFSVWEWGSQRQKSCPLLRSGILSHSRKGIVEGGVDGHRSQRWTLAGLLSIVYDVGTTRNEGSGTLSSGNPVSVWASMGRVLAAVKLSSRGKHFQGRALERTYWKSTWSQSEPQFPFLHSKVV